MVVEEEAVDTGGVLGDGDLAHAEVAHHGVAADDHAQVVQKWVGGRPEMRLRNVEDQRRAFDPSSVGDRLAIRYHGGVELDVGATASGCNAECDGFRVDVGNRDHGADMLFAHRLEPDCLPDPGDGAVPYTVGPEHLLAARLRT